MEIETSIVVHVEGRTRAEVFVEDEIVRIDELAARRVEEFQLIAGIITANADTSKGC